MITFILQVFPNCYTFTVLFSVLYAAFGIEYT